MIFTKETKSKIENLDLHDAELIRIICDYNGKKIEIPVKLSDYPNGVRNAKLVFMNVQYECVSFLEPWGPGIYIYEIKVENDLSILEQHSTCKIDENCFCVKIIMNSGDEITVMASQMVYSED